MKQLKVKIHTHPIYIFWMLKIIFDMFYQLKMLTVIITAFAILLLIIAITKRFPLKPCISDTIVILIALMFTGSWLKSPELYLDYLKIISSLLLYFLGRFYVKDIDTVWESLTSSLLFALVINLIVCLAGKGTIVWGSAVTYRGMYFFKTDFAVMLCYFLITWIYNKKMEKTDFIPLAIAVVLIVLCNARIIYLCTIVALFIFFQYRKNKKIISFKNVLMLGCAFLVCIYALRFVSNTKFFQDRGLLSLHFDKLSDLMNASNTQGRNEIWTLLLTAFNRQNIFTKIFGAAMNFNQIFGYSGLNEHNTYVKVLINTGYCGLVLFTLLFFIAIKEINDTPDRKLSCYTLSVLMVFLIVGFSVPTILYTNCSWIPLFMIGGCISSAQENYNVEVVET